MFAPRSVASKGKGKAVDTTLEATEAPTPAADSLPAQTALEVEDEAEVEPVGRERLEKVLFELEVALSDWGLARFPALLEALRKDDQGYVAVSAVLDLPPLQALDATQHEIEAIERELSSELIELHDAGTRLRRRTPLNETAISYTLAEWAEMTFYVEDLPQIPGQRSTPSSVRSLLSEVFSTPVQTVRFPPLYDRDDSRANSRSTSGDVALYELHPAYNDLDKDTRRSQRLPYDGGPSKGFAFVVLGDLGAAKKAYAGWSSEREVVRESLNSVEDGDGTRTALDRARASALKLMPLRDFNALRASYLAYKRGLEKLEDEYDERDRRDWRERDRKRERDRYERSSHPRRDDKRVAADDRVDDQARPSDVARWGHRTPSPEAETVAEGGVLVQLRNVNSRAKPMCLKAALNAVLASVDSAGAVHFVDQAFGSVRATIRVSDVEAAQALVEFFGKGDLRTHTEAYGEDADAFEPLGPMDEEAPIVRASILSEEDGAAYRAEAKRAETESRRDGGSSKRRSDGPSRGGKAKHQRFD